MIEVRKETMFQKLKTEILPLKQDQFTDIIHEIMLRSSEGHDQSIAINTLSACFNGDQLIKNLVADGFSDNWYEKTIMVYSQLVANRQSEFRKSIHKKFKSKEMEVKEPGYDKDSYILVEKRINIDEIKIPNKFKEALPSGYKISKVYDYHKKHGKFPIKVVMDSNNSLLSGYPVLLVCKMIDISEILCYNMLRKPLQKRQVGEIMIAGCILSNGKTTRASSIMR